MSHSPFVSLVIVTFGRSDYLEQLIGSIRETSPSHEREVIVVSSDPRESKKAKWLRQQKDLVTLFVDERLPGQTRKKSLYYYTNYGLKAAKGEWLFVLNDDMKMSKNWFRELKSTVSQHSNVGMIITASHIGATNLGPRIPIIGKVRQKNDSWRNIYLADVAVIRSNVLESVGYFDEHMDWYGSGVDNSLKIELLSEYQVITNSKIVIDHFIASELREVNRGTAFWDFNYIHRKWQKWGKKNSVEIQVTLGTKPYSILSVSSQVAQDLNHLVFRWIKQWLSRL